MTDKNPFDDELDSLKKAEEKPKSDEKPAEAEKTKDEKPKAEKARRTKAEKLIDDIESAKALLRENGFDVREDSGDAEDEEVGEASQPDFLSAVAESPNGVLSALSGQVSATIDMNAVSVPVLRITLVGWVGTAPLELTADSISDIRKVLDDLESQAS